MTPSVSAPNLDTRPVCVECGQHEETLPDGTPYGGWGLWFGKYCSRCALTTGKTTEAEDE